MAQAIRVGIVEDQDATREGLASLIDATPGFHVVGRYGSMEDALAGLQVRPADVVLLDIQLPGMSGLDGVAVLQSAHPLTQTLILTVYGDDDRIFRAICAGAVGYLLKDTPPARLVEAVREAHAGGAPMSPEIARRVVRMFQRVAPPRRETHGLTPRETDVLRALADGHSYKTAAGVLGLSEDTVRFHVRHLYEKLHVHSKSEAVLKAFRDGIL